ncbi:hypothetical protein DXG01_013016 [Tephrocybe rancida]|nr:hypothetical protein DXG01_013016 [Tephrocybe rancida]
MSFAIEALKPYISSWLPDVEKYLSALAIDDVTPKSFQKLQKPAVDDPASALPAINRLPSEILVEIFSSELQFRPPSGDEPFDTRPRRRSLVMGKKLDPFLLSQVCKHWRSVTFSSPLLWRSMSVLCNLRPQTVDLLAFWLQRSADLPLNIKFVESLCDMKSDDEWLNPPQNPITPQMMSLLTAHAHRWKTIDFEFSLQISPVLVDMPEKSFKMLESAKLRSRRATNLRFDGLSPLVKVWDAFHASPFFRAADYEMEYVDHKLHEIPWDRLTAVHVISTLQDLFQVLPLCTKLLELHFTDSLTHYPARALPVKEGPSGPLPSVKLPTLRHLSMTTTLSPDEAFQRLELPLLTSVYFRQNNIWIAKPDPFAFTNLLTRSQCALKQFSFQGLGSPIGEEILCDMLVSPTMSSITDLKVEAQVTERFAKLMTAGQAALPALEALTLVRCSMPPGVLGEMVSSFKRDHETFRVFNAECWDRHDADRKILSDLRKGGMLIKD